MPTWLLLIPILAAPVAPAIEGIHQLALRLEFEQALAGYESFGRARSDVQALIEAADLAAAMAEPARAAGSLLRAAALDESDPRSSGWRLRAGQLYLAANQADTARQALLPLVAAEGHLHPSRSDRAQAWLLLGRLDLDAGRVGRGRVRLGKVVAAWKNGAGTARMDLAASAAEAALRLTRIDAQKLTWDLPPRMDPDTLKPWLEERLAAFRVASEGLAGVFQYGALRFSIQAALERARLLARFVRWLWDFPPPPGLTPEQVELYREVLSDHGSSFRDRAVEMLERVIWLVAEHQLAADAGLQARQELDALEPALRWWHLRRPPLPAPLPIDPAAPRLKRAADALGRAPGDPQALLLAAEGLLVDRRPALARYVLERLASPSVEQRLLLVRVLVDGGHPDLAYAQARSLTREHPRLAPAWRWRVELESRFGDLSGASRSLTALEKASPAQADLGLCRAILAVGQGELDQARGALEALVGRAPERADAHYDLALLLMAAGRDSADEPNERTALVRRAIVHLERAQQLGGGNDAEVAQRRTRAVDTLRAIEAVERELVPSREEL